MQRMCAGVSWRQHVKSWNGDLHAVHGVAQRPRLQGVRYRGSDVHLELKNASLEFSQTLAFLIFKESFTAARQIVGLPAGAVRSFVLDNDPVPRAMLSVDPTFALQKATAPLSWLLEARRRLLGDGAALTPERFLYENVGEVYLIRWSPEAGQNVGALPADAASQPCMYGSSPWQAVTRETVS